MMKILYFVLLTTFCYYKIVSTSAFRQVTPERKLTQIADFGWGNRPTGVAVSSTKSSDGSPRIFVTFPRWFANHSAPTVAEVIDYNTIKAYPNASWNSWSPTSTNPSQQFVNAQSAFIDHMDRLWVLDVGAAFLGNVTKKGPKLVLIDMENDNVERIYDLDDIAEITSYLNDVRISEDGNHAFITDSNMGGIRVVDLTTGQGRILLEDDPSTHAEPGFVTSVEGQPMLLANDKPAAFASDGIAVLNGYVYYHACTGRTLYRIKESLLTDITKTKKEVQAGIETVGLSGVPDGLVTAGDASLKGTLYMTAIEKDGVDYLDPSNRVLPFVSNDVLQWPDSLSVPVLSTNGEPNYIYITCSQVNTAPIIKNAKPRRNTYGLYRAELSCSVDTCGAENYKSSSISSI
jgi:DNA-binding beta-propeller fold protein YncE